MKHTIFRHLFIDLIAITLGLFACWAISIEHDYENPPGNVVDTIGGPDWNTFENGPSIP